MMEFFSSDNMAEILMVAGLAALIIEVAVLGFATFVLLFLGASLLITGLAMTVGLLDTTLVTALWSNALLTTVLALGLWKPLRRMQNNVESKEVNSDFAAETFILEVDVDIQGNTTRAYSGVQWKLKSQQPIAAGTLVKVIKTEVGVMWVEAA
ncbi:NfeD family protein [Bacterioplanoides sp. SCSIO 12839]|uniref:NfeD family protein n=1 Tax=Bacterioplanoides sp. SCSIO 12839 TaxID=2829569 RepID=UPI002107E83E|nr:NfeD family protein [Bacterioplanoides sp. SCSIO 12839]